MKQHPTAHYVRQVLIQHQPKTGVPGNSLTELESALAEAQANVAYYRREAVKLEETIEYLYGDSAA